MIEHSYGIIPFLKTEEKYKVFLIHQYGSGGDTLWTFPKGRPEPGEEPLQTALRECKEETAIILVKVFNDAPLSTSYTFFRKGELIEKTSTYYVGVAEGWAYVIQAEEVKEAGWFDIDEARERITFPNYKKLLDEAVILLDKSS
jgi:bis(5'-nucleosidyl)-tetraphosphatase